MILITGVNENELQINGDGSCKILDFESSVEEKMASYATTPKTSTFITLSGGAGDMVGVYQVVNNSPRTLRLLVADLMIKQHVVSAGNGVATVKFILFRSNSNVSSSVGPSLNPASNAGIEVAATDSQRLRDFNNIFANFAGANITNSLGFFEPMGSSVFSGSSAMSAPFNMDWGDMGPEFRPQESLLLALRNMPGGQSLAGLTISGSLQFSFVEGS